MPIRAENLSRYPKEWPLISARVREMAGHKCEHCGARNGAWGYREEGRFHDVGHEGFPRGYRPPFDWGGRRIIRIVLTVAHLDHRPENCAWENLRSLCQQCHNRYDAKTRANGIRLRAMGTPDLLELTGSLAPKTQTDDGT